MPERTEPTDDPSSALARDVAAFLSVLAHQRRASANTVAAYGRDLAQLVAFAGKNRPAPLTVASIDIALLRGWLGQLARTHAPPSVARKISSVRAFLRHLRRTGRVTADPSRGLALPKSRRRLPKVVNVDAAAQIVTAFDGDDPRSLRNRAILELLYGSGLRVGEVVGLDVRDVDLASGEARVVGKGSKERVVPLGGEAIEALRAWLADQPKRGPGDPLFASPRARRLTTRTVQTIVKKAGMLGAGRGDLHPHALRHTCATHMLDGGADLRAIQEMLGHASLQTTQRYTHVSMEQILRAYDKAHPLAKEPLAKDGAA
ncbi:MAG: tyrosine recombinase XerC [Polyangiaceae bacterium]